MDPILPAEPPVPFKDRSVWLAILGGFTVLAGLACALFVPLVIVSAYLPRNTTGQPPADTHAVLPAAAVYGVMAIALIWLGVGSILTRRWARALLLIFSWSVLVVGVITLAIWLTVAPGFLASLNVPQPEGKPPIAGTVRFVVAVITIATLITLFIVPGIIGVLFYGSKHVKATCEARNPRVCWTDRCPLPVLAGSLWVFFGAVMMLPTLLAYHLVFPFFGMFVTGIGAMAGYAIMELAFVYSAWALYKLDARGWWVLLIWICVWAVSSVLTYSRHDIIEMYELMGFSDQQLVNVQRLGFMRGGGMVWISVLAVLPYLFYLLYIRRYFRAPAREGLAARS